MSAYKIMQLLPRLECGGVENIVLALNRGLVGCGMRSIVISLGGALADTIEADGGSHHSCDIASKNIFTAWPRARKLRQHINVLQPDLIHVHSRVPAWLLWLLRDANTPPVVSTVHGFHSNPWYSNVLLAADRVICPCNELFEAMAAAREGSRQRLRLVPDGVDTDVYDPRKITSQKYAELRQKLGVPGMVPVVAMPGRFSSRKGHKLLLLAMALLAKQGVPMVLLLAGGGAAAAGLQQQCASYGLHGKVIFVDTSLTMVEIMAISDVVVSASLKPEGFGLTMVEAHAMGRPVVAAAHGGALDIVKPGVNGELFAPGDYAALAASLRKATEAQWDSELIRSGVCSSFTSEAMLEATIKVYRELLP